LNEEERWVRERGRIENNEKRSLRQTTRMRTGIQETGRYKENIPVKWGKNKTFF